MLACQSPAPPEVTPAAPPAVEQDGSDLTIAYSHNFSGEIEPCG